MVGFENMTIQNLVENDVDLRKAGLNIICVWCIPIEKWGNIMAYPSSLLDLVIFLFFTDLNCCFSASAT